MIKWLQRQQINIFVNLEKAMWEMIAESRIMKVNCHKSIRTIGTGVLAWHLLHGHRKWKEHMSSRPVKHLIFAWWLLTRKKYYVGSTFHGHETLEK